MDDEVTIYTWRDATLKELSDLIKEVNVECRRRDSRFSFQLVYYDFRGAARFKSIGIVSNSRAGRDDVLTLESLRFVQGDFIDVAIYTGDSVPTAHPPSARDGRRSGNGAGRLFLRRVSADRDRPYGRRERF